MSPLTRSSSRIPRLSHLRIKMIILLAGTYHRDLNSDLRHYPQSNATSNLFTLSLCLSLCLSLSLSSSISLSRSNCDESLTALFRPLLGTFDFFAPGIRNDGVIIPDHSEAFLSRGSLLVASRVSQCHHFYYSSSLLTTTAYLSSLSMPSCLIFR